MKLLPGTESILLAVIWISLVGMPTSATAQNHEDGKRKLEGSVAVLYAKSHAFISLAIPQLKYQASTNVTIGVGMLPAIGIYRQESKTQVRPQIGAALIVNYKRISFITANMWESSQQQWLWANGFGFKF